MLANRPIRRLLRSLPRSQLILFSLTYETHRDLSTPQEIEPHQAADAVRSESFIFGFFRFFHPSSTSTSATRPFSHPLSSSSLPHLSQQAPSTPSSSAACWEPSGPSTPSQSPSGTRATSSSPPAGTAPSPRRSTSAPRLLQLGPWTRDRALVRRRSSSPCESGSPLLLLVLLLPLLPLLLPGRRGSSRSESPLPPFRLSEKEKEKRKDNRRSSFAARGGCARCCSRSRLARRPGPITSPRC